MKGAQGQILINPTGSIGSSNYYTTGGLVIRRQKGFPTKKGSFNQLKIKSIHSRIKNEFKTQTLPGGNEIYESWAETIIKNTKSGPSPLRPMEYAIAWRSLGLYYDITESGPTGLPSGSLDLPILQIFEYVASESFGFWTLWEGSEEEHLIVEWTNTYYPQNKVFPKTYDHRDVIAWSTDDQYRSTIHFRLNDHSATSNINDTSGNELDGTLSAGHELPTAQEHSVKGKIFEAIDFTNFNTKITLNDNELLHFNDGFIFSCWIFMRSSPTNDTSVVRKISAGFEFGYGYEIRIPSSRRPVVDINNGTIQWQGFAVDQIPLNEWTHIACIVNPANTFYFFINGAVTNTQITGLSIPDSFGSQFVIGQSYVNQEYLDGILDDFRISDFNLDTKFIGAIYNNGAGMEKKKFNVYNLPLESFEGPHSFWLRYILFSEAGSYSHRAYLQFRKNFVGS